MAFGMLELSKLPLEAQEEILSKLSSEDKCPIEIDSKVYYIPTAVNELIETLYEQTCIQKGEHGIPRNKE
tara:strand:+ start:116 stop:325 length:210 start_codon:yes stop_codon:yes gene_type:complete